MEVTHARVKYFIDNTIEFIPVENILEFKKKKPKDANDFKKSKVYRAVFSNEKNPQKLILKVLISDLACGISHLEHLDQNVRPKFSRINESDVPGTSSMNESSGSDNRDKEIQHSQQQETEKKKFVLKERGLNIIKKLNKHKGVPKITDSTDESDNELQSKSNNSINTTSADLQLQNKLQTMDKEGFEKSIKPCYVTNVVYLPNPSIPDHLIDPLSDLVNNPDKRKSENLKLISNMKSNKKFKSTQNRAYMNADYAQNKDNINEDDTYNRANIYEDSTANRANINEDDTQSQDDRYEYIPDEQVNPNDDSISSGSERFHLQDSFANEPEPDRRSGSPSVQNNVEPEDDESTIKNVFVARFAIDCVNYYKTKEGHGSIERKKRYKPVDDDGNLYLGEGKKIKPDVWRMMQTEKPNIFLRELTLKLWDPKDLANRALDKKKVSKPIPNRSPVKTIEFKLLRLLISLFDDYLQKQVEYSADMKAKFLKSARHIVSQKIRDLRTEERKKATKRNNTTPVNRKLRYS